MAVIDLAAIRARIETARRRGWIWENADSRLIVPLYEEVVRLRRLVAQLQPPAVEQLDLFDAEEEA